MLQFITQPSDKFSTVQLVAKALEGGCRWIHLSMPGATDSEVVAVATEIIPLCKEAEAILVIESAVEAVMTTLVHGVYLLPGDRTVADVRQYLGPNAVIGCQADSAERLLEFAKLDVDYVALGPNMPLDAMRDAVARFRQTDSDLHPVAVGNYGEADIIPLLSTGVEGVAVSDAIALADDPAAATARLLAQCRQFVLNQ